MTLEHMAEQVAKQLIALAETRISAGLECEHCGGLDGKHHITCVVMYSYGIMWRLREQK